MQVPQKLILCFLFLFAFSKSTAVALDYNFKPKLAPVSNSIVQEVKSWWSFDVSGVKPSSKVITLTYKDAESFELRMLGTELELSWKGFAKDSSKLPFRVVLLLSLDENQNLEFKLNIENQTKDLAIQKVVFPKVQLELEGSSQTAHCILPKGQGRIIKNPFDYSLHKKRSWQFNYPARGLMPWLACYDEKTKKGLFLESLDPKQILKKFVLEARGKNKLVLKVVRRSPLKELRGKSYMMLSSMKLRKTKGDWFDIAKLYRSLAKDRVWLSKGRLENRLDIPDWYKDSPATFVLRTSERKLNQRERLVSAKRLLKKLNWPAKARAALFWYKWQDYDKTKTSLCAGRVCGDDLIPKANVHAGYYPGRGVFGGEKFNYLVFNQALKDIGLMPVFYLNTKLVDPLIPSDILKKLRASLIEGRVGIPRLYTLKHPQWIACRRSPVWNEHYQALSKKILKDYSAFGIYWDSLGGQTPNCFDGEVISNFEDEMLIFAREQYKLKREFPEAIFVDENGPETLIAERDASLNHSNFTYNSVPLQQVVYHDYWLTFGRTIDSEFLREFGEQSFNYALAKLFTEGRQIGRIDLDLADVSNEKLTYLGALVLAKYRLRSWLNFGEMLKSPEVLGAEEVSIAHFNRELKEHNSFTASAVIASRWKNTAGDELVLVTNYTKREQRFSLLAEGLEKRQYQLEPHGILEIKL